MGLRSGKRTEVTHLPARTAVILAAGKGTRMNHPSLPKPLVPVDGVPMLERVLAGLVRGNHTRIVLVVGHLSDLILARYGSTFEGMKVDYAVQARQRGTAHAISCAAHLVQGEKEVLLAWADTLVRATWYGELWEEWDHRPGLVALHTVTQGDPSTGSLVDFDSQLQMTAILSKPEGVTYGWRDGGVSIQSAESVAAMEQVGPSPTGERQFTSGIQNLLAEKRRVGVALYDGPWYDLADEAAIRNAELHTLGALD